MKPRRSGVVEIGALCQALEVSKPTYSADPTTRTRHIALTLQLAVTATTPLAPPQAK